MLVNHDLPLVDEIDALGSQQALKKTRAKVGPERLQQQAVVPYLRQVLPSGSKVAAIVNEAPAEAKTGLARSRYYRARQKAGVLGGMPDIVCALPGGRVLWIEMKAPKSGRLSEGQRDIHADMRAIGHQVGCATSIETARWLLHEWKVPVREPAGAPMWPAKVGGAKPRVRLPADKVPF